MNHKILPVKTDWQEYTSAYLVVNWSLRPDDLYFAVKADFDDLGG